MEEKLQLMCFLAKLTAVKKKTAKRCSESKSCDAALRMLIELL